MVATLLKARWKKMSAKSAAAQVAEIDEDEEQEYKPLDWKLVKRLGTMLRPYKKIYIIGTSLGLVHISLELAGPWFMKWIIDYVTAYVKHDSSGSTEPGWGKWVVDHLAAVIGGGASRAGRCDSGVMARGGDRGGVGRGAGGVDGTTAVHDPSDDVGR